MVTSCVAFNCTNRHSPNSGLIFHLFPFKNKELLGKWIHALRRDKWTPSKSSRICSAHFEPSCYEQNGWSSRKALKADAVPSIFAFPEHLQEKSKPRPPPKRKISVEDSCEGLPGSSSSSISGGGGSVQDFSSGPTNLNFTESESKEPKAKKKRECFPGDFKILNETLPPTAVKCIQKCKQVIADKNKRIKMLKQRNRRLLKKIKSLETLVQHLRNDLASEDGLSTLLVSDCQ